MKKTVITVLTSCVFLLLGCETPQSREEFLAVAKLREMRIAYWIRARPAGVYDGISDSGLRKRIVVVRDVRKIAGMLAHFDLEKISEYGDGAEVCEGNVILFDDKGLLWGGDFISQKAIRCMNGELWTLASNDFYISCHAFCGISEKDLRASYVDMSEIALLKSKTKTLSPLSYNPQLDGDSPSFVLETVCEKN